MIFIKFHCGLWIVNYSFQATESYFMYSYLELFSLLDLITPEYKHCFKVLFNSQCTNNVFYDSVPSSDDSTLPGCLLWEDDLG